jgi:molybdopterin converting factor small subunit
MPSSRERTAGAASAITVRCRLFGRYAEVFGVSEVGVSLAPGATVADAIAELRRRPGGEGLLPPRPLAAVNHWHVALDAPLADGDELAVLPPLAGG